MQGQERRNTSTERVIVETLVEMCGMDAAAAPAFEAESVNVSGRGMQVKTAYLPEVGTPLVCRFEHQGHEIIVEGSVVWRRDADAEPHLDGVVVVGYRRGQGLARVILEDFCKRLANDGHQVLRTHFSLQGFFSRLGFQLDQQRGGLVRRLA